MTPIVVRVIRAGTAFEFPSQKMRELWRQAIARFGSGEDFEVVVRALSKKQGTQSMRYYRGVVIPDIARACGYEDPDEFEAVHQAYAWKFLRIADHPLGFPRRRSTRKADLSQEEMTAYIDQVIRDAETSIVGCRVRRPNEIENWDHVPDYEWAA